MRKWFSGSTDKYSYTRREFLITRTERECYKILLNTVGNDYYVFPQIHLPAIINGTIFGQSWRGAFRHVDEKSVDFVLCDKALLSPKLAIELDDYTHERSDRRVRDAEVERVLHMAGVPLLRLKNEDLLNQIELAQKIKSMVL